MLFGVDPKNLLFSIFFVKDLIISSTGNLIVVQLKNDKDTQNTCFTKITLSIAIYMRSYSGEIIIKDLLKKNTFYLCLIYFMHIFYSKYRSSKFRYSNALLISSHSSMKKIICFQIMPAEIFCLCSE